MAQEKVAGWQALPGSLAGGVAAVALVAWAARWVGGALPAWLGPPVVGLLMGMGLRAVLGQQPWLEQGAQFTLKRLLRLAVILFGSTLSLGQAARIGAGALGVIAVTVVLALGLTWAVGRWMGVPPRLCALIGAGTAICGATAIVTVAPILRAGRDETAFALSTIFFFNMVAVLAYPLVGHLLGLPDPVFGLWAGTAIHDTSSVLAAAFAYSQQAGQVATVVKLTRTLVLVPLAVAMAVAVARGPGQGPGAGPGGGTGRVPGGRLAPVARNFPWFVLGFVAMAALRSAGWLSDAWAGLFRQVGQFLVVMVLVGVGVSADWARIRRLGAGPLLLGLFASLVIALASLLLAGAAPVQGVG
ncbi:MAG TPA: putative sulfate exporter family transporter [Limnochordales bacterium]